MKHGPGALSTSSLEWLWGQWGSSSEGIFTEGVRLGPIVSVPPGPPHVTPQQESQVS